MSKDIQFYMVEVFIDFVFIIICTFLSLSVEWSVCLYHQRQLFCAKDEICFIFEDEPCLSHRSSP